MSSTPSPTVLPTPLEADLRALIEAWRGGAKVSGLPHPVSTVESAYSIQTAFVSLAGGAGGWKVSPLRPGGPPRCSPIPASLIETGSRSGRLPAGCLLEIEIGVRLGADVAPGNGGVTRDAVAAAIDTVHPAIEIVVSRFAAGLEAPDLDRLADFQSCGGVVFGEGVRDWRGMEFASFVAEIADADGVRRGNAGQPSTAQTLDALVWLAEHAAARGLPLRAGQIIITGARLGPLPPGKSAEVVARVGALGEVRLSCIPQPAAG